MPVFWVQLCWYNSHCQHSRKKVAIEILGLGFSELSLNVLLPVFIQMETLWSWLFPPLRRISADSSRQLLLPRHGPVLEHLAHASNPWRLWWPPGSSQVSAGAKISYGKFLNVKEPLVQHTAVCSCSVMPAGGKVLETFRNWRGHCLGGWPCPSALSTGSVWPACRRTMLNSFSFYGFEGLEHFILKNGGEHCVEKDVW